MKLKMLSLRDVVFLCFSFSIYLNSYFYMTWSTYYNGVLQKILTLFSYFAVLMLLFYCVINRRSKLLSFNNLIILLGLILTFITISWIGSAKKITINISHIIVLISFIIYCQLEKKEQAEIFEYIYKIFIIFVLPSVIYFILSYVFKFNIPSEILLPAHEKKVAYGLYYEWRPLGLILTGRNMVLPRLCGVFDEPGVVGTLAGIFLPITLLKNKKRGDRIWTILLFIEGILSMSMAFYVLCAITICGLAFRKGAVKLAISIIILMAGIVLFTKISFNNPTITALQNRIDLTSSILIKDNRTNTYFDYAYERLFENGGTNLLFGYGIGAVSSDQAISASYSYKCLIYDYGIIGTILYLGVFLEIAVLKYGISKNNLTFLVVFLASVYQRPYILNLQYFTIFCFALSSIEYHFSDSMDIEDFHLVKKKITIDKCEIT